MVALCQNGLPVCAENETEVVSAGGRDWRFRTGDVAYIFRRFINRYVQEVEPILGGVLDDWSYVIRNVRDSDTNISNHAGYAFDANALRNQRGVKSPLNARQLQALRQLLADFWAIGWGADYKDSPVDPMHFEIKKGITFKQLAAFANALKHNTPVGPGKPAASTPVNPADVKITPAVQPTLPKFQPTKAPPFPLPKGYYFGPKEGPKESISGYFSYSADLKKWQEVMQARGWNINPDGHYGSQTRDVVIAFEKDKRLTVDAGWIGPQVWRAAFESPVTNGKVTTA